MVRLNAHEFNSQTTRGKRGRKTSFPPAESGDQYTVISNMKINVKTVPFTLAFAAKTSVSSSSGRLQESKPSASGSQTNEPASIYAVDELPRLTELYTSLLHTMGHVVRAFNHRAKALVALKADRRPALLITNYLGYSMPIDNFIEACRSVHPSLQILMVSGFDQSAMVFSRARPDRFIQKPFTPEQFHTEVAAALAF